MEWITQFFEKLPRATVGVAGEIGIDEYYFGNTSRISPEAPVPVVEIESTEKKLGLAGNVAQNILSLGAQIDLISVRGEDLEGELLEKMLDTAGIPQRKLLVDPTRPTLKKTRVIAQKQHVVRVDFESCRPLAPQLATDFVNVIRERLPKCDAFIVQDYAKGIWSADTMGFMREALELGKPIYVDPNRLTPVETYQKATLLTPNFLEAEVLSGMRTARDAQERRNPDRLQQMATKILNSAAAEQVVITCGEYGMVALSRQNFQLVQIPTFAREVYDVTGAGDTVIAVLTLARVCGLTLPQAMVLANAAAGLVVARVGAATVTPEELKTELDRLTELGLVS